MVALLWAGQLGAQVTLTGTVLDSETTEELIGANVVIQGTTQGGLTDFEGKFKIPYSGALPAKLIITYTGYDSLVIEATKANLGTLKMQPAGIMVETVEIVGNQMLQQRLLENPKTVETMSADDIKNSTSADFYEGLGNLKGVDVTSASLGFKIINTRGFNSTTPVRSLQLIDGVDNQAPGLNFSLGNFVGASELDVQNVELVVGASSARYGPGAFNGALNMTTKSPFLHPGLSASFKYGERNLMDAAVRYAHVIKDKNNKDRFALKLNVAFMRADDWEAGSLNPVEGSLFGMTNPGGYDAVNRYGDEVLLPRLYQYDNPGDRALLPGLGNIFRTGYMERDIVDYNTYSLKLQPSVFYKITDDVVASYAYKYSTGTTVYQGDNRYSLKDLVFQQHSVEIKKDNKFFVRAYYTTEDAGKSYDAVFTSLLLNYAAKSDQQWAVDYQNFWRRTIIPEMRNQWGFSSSMTLEEIDALVQGLPAGVLEEYHARARRESDSNRPNFGRDNYSGPSQLPSQNRFEPGTDAFRNEFNRIVSNPLGFNPDDPRYLQGGTRFVDNSSLYHVWGEYQFDPTWMDIAVGASYRLYTPNSQGTIFSDTLISREDPSLGFRSLTVYEIGSYLALEKRLLKDSALILNASVRFDKSQNFDGVISPAASGVYKFNDRNSVRFSISSALRNPTLQDQYLYYNVGRAILVGNLTGVDSVVTLESLVDYFDNAATDVSLLRYINIAPLRPEQVFTVELGYKGSPFDKFLVDASIYHNWYQHFLGFNIVADYPDPTFRATDFTIYRVAANATEGVTTVGAAVGLSYYIGKFYAVSGNYSFNQINLAGVNDPIIPAFNTPRHKFNLGFSGREINASLFNDKLLLRDWGFGINFRWVEGFEFTGSPQFTGSIPTYYTLDAQINKDVKKWNMNFKAGASNILNRPFIQAYGGPEIGRLAFVQVAVDIK
jgi:outer membrane receptor protein involved in Fe transport